MASLSHTVGIHLPYSFHTLPILMPYFKVWLHYGYSMATVWVWLENSLWFAEFGCHFCVLRLIQVVEQHCSFDRFGHLLRTRKRLPLQELVLHGIVYAFGHRVVLRVAALRHAGDDMAVRQRLDVIRAGVLRAAV